MTDRGEGGWRLVAAQNVVAVRERARARALLERVAGLAANEEIDALAERLVRGELILVREPGVPQLDPVRPNAIPLLSALG